MFQLMKKAVLVSISIFGCFISIAQSKIIKEVFRLLPTDQVYDLSLATRDSMLAGKTYYPADNDSDQIVAYNLGISTDINDYMYVSMSFETAQRATGMIEIRSFKMTNGENLILVSQTGGIWQVNYRQHDVFAFIYNKNKKLVPYKKEILPEANESLFMKPGIPDSVKKEILNNSNLTYNLSGEKIILSLDSYYISDDDTMRKWLKGNLVYFDWIKDRFVMGKFGFE